MNDHKDSEEPRFWHTVREDLRQGGFKRSLGQDFRELKEFYLSRKQKAALEKMGWARRWLYLLFWLFKILVLRLSSVRRLLLLIAILLPFITVDNSKSNEGLFILSGIILLFILALELKDKLLAHHEISQGRLIQQALMPQRNPDVPGWELWLSTRPANEIGGDLVDFLKINDNRFALTLADVSGKGLGAALLMAKLQATIRALVPDTKSLDQLGEKINEIFYRDTLRSAFASLVYLELRSHSGSVRLINAGHHPPLKLDNGGIEGLAKGGTAIGLTPHSSYFEQPVHLNEGDSLLIYSDGLTEAQNERGEFFGEKRLFDLISKTKVSSARELGERLLAEVDEFIGQARRNDDLSMIVIRFVG